MKAIHLTLDPDLLRAIDLTARRTELSRSALIRQALRAHLNNLKIREQEEQDRKGYQAVPAHPSEPAHWESQAVWPNR